MPFCGALMAHWLTRPQKLQHHATNPGQGGAAFNQWRITEVVAEQKKYHKAVRKDKSDSESRDTHSKISKIIDILKGESRREQGHTRMALS